MATALLQVSTIEPTTAVSLAVLFVLLGAGWKLSAQLNVLVARVDAVREQIAKLDSLPERFGRMETRVEGIERELESLWREISARREKENR